MTENKRFTMCHEQNDLNGWTMSIVDWETEQPFDYTTYEVHSSSITDTKDEMEDLCLLLNNLNETIQNSKKYNAKLYQNHLKTDRELVNQIIKLKNENERLLKANMELTEENTNILHLIRTAYNNERTSIGRNTLKQLIEALE